MKCSLSIILIRSPEKREKITPVIEDTRTVMGVVP